MFTYFIPLTVNLTKNSKFKKFVHELKALWKPSGSSMGALRELVAVAGMQANKYDHTLSVSKNCMEYRSGIICATKSRYPFRT
jgi:hypothetical protein